jgi:glucokinase
MKTDVVLGIDIGGTNTVFGWIDRKGNILSNESIKTQPYRSFEELITDIYKHSLLEVQKQNLKPLGVGIGAPNGNYYKGTIEFAPNLHWDGVIQIVELTKKTFNLPSFLTNDANAAAIGEMLYGGAKGMKDFIVITLGTGVGSGFVVNGNVMYGSDGFAGEIGHTTIDQNGRLCGCGRKGCLETYTSANGICITATEILKNSNLESSLRNIDPKLISARDISEAALKGDQVALQAFDSVSRILGARLADVVAITSPEAIFLFGGLVKAGDLLLVPVKKYMEQNLLKIFKNKVAILPSLLPGADAAILGASALGWMELEKK